MTDDPAIQQALEDALRTVQRADQHLAAARDANGRLTAQLVAAELREKMLIDQVGLQADRIEALEAKVAEWQRVADRLQQALVDAAGLRERYESELARRRASDR